MIHLLLSTLAMMGLTFLIGFFVAAVIKLIAYAADSFDFYSSHRLELLRLRRWRQHRQKVERLVRQIPIADEDALGDFREDYSKGIDRNFTGYSGYYHGVSPGPHHSGRPKPQRGCRFRCYLLLYRHPECGQAGTGKGGCCPGRGSRTGAGSIGRNNRKSCPL
mgnify:CR=1 FL=1